MKKVLVLEVYVDEKLSDGKECVTDVITSAITHEYISDGSVDIKVIQDVYEDEADLKMVRERLANNNGKRYSLEEVRKMCGKNK